VPNDAAPMLGCRSRHTYIIILLIELEASSIYFSCACPYVQSYSSVYIVFSHPALISLLNVICPGMKLTLALVCTYLKGVLI